MMNFTERVMRAAKKYTVWDFACLKITLLSLGILIGAYFADFFLAYAVILWPVFIFSYIWIMYKTFIKYMGRTRQD